MLHHFAKLGSAFMKDMYAIESPRIGLLSNGAEPTKGNKVVKEAHLLLKDDESLNFIGNIEGNNALSGECDVLVCDGFAGNQVLTAPTTDAKLRFVFDTNMTVAAGKLNGTQQIKILFTAETNRSSTDGLDFLERRGNDVYIIFGGQAYRVAAVGETFNYRVEFREIETALTEDPNQAGKSYKPFEMKLYINDELIATREEQIDAGSGNYDAEPQRVQFSSLSSTCDIKVTFDSTYVDRYVAP
jgi:hypothetical protein